MRRIWRIGVVATLAAASFVVAIGRFSDAAEQGCAQRVRENPAYEAHFVEGPSTDVLRYRMAITRDGEDVTGADVCLNAHMRGMSAMGTTDAGEEISPGIYEFSLTFEMGGRWAGRVLITEPGRPVAAVPLVLEVEEDP